MRRREFITLLGGAAATLSASRAAFAQQRQGKRIVGYLGSGEANAFAHLTSSIRKGLAETGFVEGKDVAFEYRFAEAGFDRLPALAADLVRHPVDIIIATPAPAAFAAKAATSTIPIVFNSGADAVELGLVASLNRPGGNLTGVTQLTASLQAKRLELLGEITPPAGRLGFLGNTEGNAYQPEVREVQAAARASGRDVHVIGIKNKSQFEAAFAEFLQQRIVAIIIGAGALFLGSRERIVDLVARNAVLAVYPWREYVDAGGLMSYAANLADINRQLGVYAGRILKGEKPADLPVTQPTKFEFVLNLKTARALGLTVPPTLLALADEVIE